MHVARQFTLILLALVGVFPIGANVSYGAARAAETTPDWKVYAIRYATIPKFPVHDLVAGADTTRTIDIAMMFWLLEGPDGRRVLVDAGFYRKKFLHDWKPRNYRRPSDALQGFRIPAESVTDIIISHVHWDHLDGADLFPKARIWIQRDEYAHYVGDHGKPLDTAIDTVDAGMLAHLKQAGRVQFVDGDDKQILPGIIAYTGGKHTFASQYLGVHTAEGTVVVASDNCYLYENLERHLPIAQTLDAKSNLAAQDRMRRLASSPNWIIPGHDPAVFKRFPSVSPGIAAIAP